MMHESTELADNPPQTIIEPGRSGQREEVVHLLERVLGLAVEMMNADRGVIVLSKNGGFEVMASRNFPPESSKALTELSTSVVRQVMDSRQSLLTHDALADPRFGQSASVILHQITSIICVPLFVEDTIIGVIYLDSRNDRQRFTDDNLDFINIFGRMAAIAVDYARSYGELYREKQRLQNELQQTWTFNEIIGQSPRMKEVFNLMRRVINSEISVLLEGGSGTGKEVVARALHYNGPRRDKPFVAQFCGNLSENLLESELFGHKKGAFTGAISDKKGLFEIADGGTFFLDEIADISPTIQAKLLRILQEGELRRVGDTESRSVNVRIVSATNKSLKGEVESGKFREDLFYRLNVITIPLPPLRDRADDIPLFVHHFLKKFAVKNGTELRKISTRAMRALENYHWPGNVRELENTIERAIILSQSDIIDIDDLFIPEEGKYLDTGKSLKEHEREYVEKVLRDCDGHKTKTAEQLGVSLRWLHYKLNEWKSQKN